MKSGILHTDLNMMGRTFFFRKKVNFYITSQTYLPLDHLQTVDNTIIITAREINVMHYLYSLIYIYYLV